MGATEQKSAAGAGKERSRMKHINTICVQGGYTPGNGEPRQIPIIQSTTFKYSTSEDMGKLFDLEASGYFYTRLQNPTNDHVAAKIAAMEGGTAAMLTSSGQAANFFAIFNICESGDHIVASSSIYGGTFNLIAVTLAKMGITATFVSPDASEEELNAAEAVLSSIQQEIATLQGKMDRELASLDEQEKDELAALDKELSARREAISEEIVRKKAELEERKSGYDREQLDSLTASGGDPKRLEEIHSRLAYIGGEIKYINETKALIIEYLKDKREMLDKVPDWTAESLRLQQIIHGEREELKKRLADVNRSIFKVDAELKELKEANRKALENREEYHRSTLLDWFTSRESIFSSMNRTDTDGDCRSLVREITIRVSEQSQKLSELRKEITAYTGNFSEDNVFAFKTSFSDDKEYMDFACDLKEFIDEDKVSEYQSRINTRNSDIFRQITADTKSMVSQEGNIRGVVDQINADFKEKNFVGIIQCIEMRIDPSQNKIVNLLKEIKRFNEEYSWDLGQNLFASSADDTATREKATTLLRELIKSMDAYSGNLIRLADFFDLKFRVIENRNDTGFVERLTNVGSEGTDILVKSMVNIMLLNVFKRNASTVFSDFRLHCMMDEIGKLHPNNVVGILKFANDRDILLINGSPTEQDALSYKHIYKLEKDGDSFTRIRRVITQFD